MVDKQGHIKYWKESAEESFQSGLVLFKGKRFMMTLFCWHLCIEKLLKAHWVKDNEENYPPRIHNLVSLHDQIIYKLPKELTEELRVINSWNIEGRYPDYRNIVYKAATNEYVLSKEINFKEIRECLLKNLQ